ncbi:MAG: hypothetical protein QXU09_04270 [Thermoproteota archaeon]
MRGFGFFSGYVRELTHDQIRDVHIMQGMFARAMDWAPWHL